MSRIYIGLAVAGGALLGAGIAAGAMSLFKSSPAPAQARRLEPYSLVESAKAGELAERFRPWLLFDSKEKWRPLNVESLFDEGTQRFCVHQAQGPRCVPIHDAKDFYGLVEGKQAGAASYVDVAGNTTDSYHGPAACRPLLDCDSGPRSAIYYHVTESNNRFYIDYWWFLRFNHFARLGLNESCALPQAREIGVCDEHEGDWEGVTVVTRPHDEKDIEYVAYAAHKGTFRYSASQLKFEGGTRPQVFLTEGGHSAYPLACAHNCHQPPGLAIDGLELPETDHDGRARWGRDAEACVPDAPGSCLLSLDGKPWTHWPGEWGAGCTAACGGALDANSPRSPGVQSRFQTPWCSFQEDLFSCDGRSQRCSDWLSAQVVAIACDPNLLTESQRSGTQLGQSELALDIAGASPVGSATTPGVVQALGAPLGAGAELTATVDGSLTEVLVRAAQGNLVSDDTFTNPAWRPGQRVHVTVKSGPDGPVVLADGRRAHERTLTERATPGALRAARLAGVR